MFQQGSDMLSIFKGFSNKTCILDDFGFYENRQKVMQGKRNKMSSSPAAATLENFQVLMHFIGFFWQLLTFKLFWIIYI